MTQLRSGTKDEDPVSTEPKKYFKQLKEDLDKRRNALSSAYHSIVVPPVILNTIYNLETSINNGAFKTLLQLLKLQIRIKSAKNPEPLDSLNNVQPSLLCFTRHRNSTIRLDEAVGKAKAIDELLKCVDFYFRQSKQDRKKLLTDIEHAFKKLLCVHFPEIDPFSRVIHPDDCDQSAQQLIKVGVLALKEWCIRPDIVKVDELVRKLNNTDDSQTIPKPKTSLQNAKTHLSLTIMLKSIDRFEPFLKVILEKTGAFNERIHSDLDTPLHYAVRSQNASFIEWLLGQKSLDLNCRNKQMKTALFLLCEQYKAVRQKVQDPKEMADQLKECRKYIILLLQNGADFNICSSKALLPYELLTHNGKPIPKNDSMQSEEQEFLIQCENVVQTKGGGPIVKKRNDKFTTEEFGRMTVELLEIFLRFKDLNTFEKEFRKI